MSKHLTKDSKGKPNGYVLEIWSALVNPELRPDQVYLTAVAPHSRKGPHLHMKRRGLFFCVKGTVRIVTRFRECGEVCASYGHMVLCDQGGALIVGPGTPCAIYNDGDTEALVLNLPSPAWSEDDPDEWPVEEWID